MNQSDAMSAIASICGETLEGINALKKQASGQPELVDEADEAEPRHQQRCRDRAVDERFGNIHVYFGRCA